MTAASLGPIVRSLLEKRHPVRRPVTDEATLERLLAKAKAPHHGPALAFERAFGGLSFPDYGEGRSWKKSSVPAWLIGAAECLASDLTFRAPGRKKLVPVLYTTNDNVVYLDADGIAWAEDTIGDTPLTMVAPNARAMMARVLLGDHVFYCPANKKVESASASGEEVATALQLEPIDEASDAAERWWSDGTTFIVERTTRRAEARTTIAYARKAALSKLGIEAPKPSRAPTGPVTFESVMNEYAPVCVVARIPSTFEPTCRSFFDASEHAPQSVIERRVGARVSLARGAFAGTIAAIEELDPATLRVQLSLTAESFVQKKSRVEIFLRDAQAVTLLNVFQFGIKDRLVEETCSRWHDEVIAPFEAGRRLDPAAPPR